MSDLIARVMPAEVIGNEEAKYFYENLGIAKLGGTAKFNEYYDWTFERNSANETLKGQFGDNYETVFGI